MTVSPMAEIMVEGAPNNALPVSRLASISPPNSAMPASYETQSFSPERFALVKAKGPSKWAVSYTHLTLPTIYSV